MPSVSGYGKLVGSLLSVVLSLCANLRFDRCQALVDVQNTVCVFLLNGFGLCSHLKLDRCPSVSKLMFWHVRMVIFILVRFFEIFKPLDPYPWLPSPNHSLEQPPLNLWQCGPFVLNTDS